jgi:hypothetical protein
MARPSAHTDAATPRRRHRSKAILVSLVTALAAAVVLAAPASAAGTSDQLVDGIDCEAAAHGEAGPIFGLPDEPQPLVIAFSGWVQCSAPVGRIAGRVDLLTPGGVVEIDGPTFEADEVQAVVSPDGWFAGPDGVNPGDVHVVRTTATITAPAGQAIGTPPGCVAVGTTAVECVATYSFTV